MTVKARMLKLLEQNENELISGEAAAAELNCTRAAIWKAVKSLREEGYTIEAGPNKGYVLRGGSRLSEEGIRLYLDHPDVPVKIYRELDSTNRAAKEAAFSGEAGHGALILARRQKSGRGRRGRSFYSPEIRTLYEYRSKTGPDSEGRTPDYYSGGNCSVPCSEENLRDRPWNQMGQ